MPTSLETRAALRLITSDAVSTGTALLGSLDGDPTTIRYQLLDTVPGLIGYYTDGTSALAADYYDNERELQAAAGRYTAEPIVADRYVKQRRAVAWASEPLFDGGDTDLAGKRLAEVVQYETARPFRDTILSNRKRDSQAYGWRRVTFGGCRFCRMLADRGAVYTEQSAGFAAHSSCGCIAEPAFKGGKAGPQASPMQYIASRKTRTPAQQAALRAYLDSHYGTD